MKISPVSFGKAVRVLGRSDNAFDIARLANEKKVSKSERNAQKDVKAIFDDVSEGQAQVLTYTTQYGDELVYVVSGKESKKLDKINDQIATGIIQSGDALLTDTETHKYHKFGVSKNILMNNYNKRKKELAINNSLQYSINAVYNDKGTAVKEINREYPSVYAVSGTKEQLEELRRILLRSQGFSSFVQATDLYVDSPKDGFCSQSVRDGKEIAFVVTGKEALRKVSFMDYGWSSVNGISKRIDEFIALDNVKEQVKQIQEAIDYDYAKNVKQ